jgi:hypothetical protein
VNADNVQIPCVQGDLIGRISAYWAIVFFGQFFNAKSQNFGATFFRGKCFEGINFDKKMAGQHFGRFFPKLIWSPCLRVT